MSQPTPDLSARDLAIGSELDTSHATPELAAKAVSVIQAKNSHDAGQFLAHFAKPVSAYSDGALGRKYDSWDQLKKLFDFFMPQWGTGTSYLTRVLGDTASGLLMFTNTPEMFGNEGRAVSPVNFDEAGKIVRQIDYWDSRAFGLEALAALNLRVPINNFPASFAEERIGSQAHPAMLNAVTALSTALGDGDVALAAARFAPDAVFEDLALHLEKIGPKAIAAFLSNALPSLPYGAGSAVRHIVGSAVGGGYEWVSPANPAPLGVTALELDSQGRITRLSAMWDGGLLTDGQVSSLVTVGIER
jgi:hypothetical protein